MGSLPATGSLVSARDFSLWALFLAEIPVPTFPTNAPEYAPELLGGLDAELVGHCGNLRPLRLGRRRKFLRPTDVEGLPGDVELRRDLRIAADRPDVGRDAGANLAPHVRKSEQAHESVEGQPRVTGFRDGRNIGRGVRPLAVRHRELPDPAGLDLRPHDGE